MQDFQSIPGLAGRLFGGAAPPDLRRGAPHGGPSRCGGASAAAAAAPEAVKCPRCESTNTKFCYYNNYNLSQPRHFCKSCRRYWTKGGVLRNVPVGGGCRKSKRSTSAPSAPSTPSPTDAKDHRRAPSAVSRTGSSGSTSPTAASATAPAPTPSTPTSNTVNITNPNPNPFVADVAPPAPIFADQAAALASLFATPPPPQLPMFVFSAPKAEPAVAPVFAEQATTATATADMTPFASLDTGIFELGDTSPAYWSTGSCWTDVPDPTIYLP